MPVKQWTAIWDTLSVTKPGIGVVYIDHFVARGMRSVYGRGDHFGNGRTFHMDVWLSRDGRLLSRFWSRRSEVDWLSLEVTGHVYPKHPSEWPAQTEDWVPLLLREEYDHWILGEW